MALTRNLRRTGLAARTARAEEREYLYEITSPLYRLNALKDQLAQDDVLAEIWMSDLIPETYSYRQLIRAAEMLLQYKGVVPQFSRLPVPEGSDNSVAASWQEHGYY